MRGKRYKARKCDEEHGHTWDLFDGDRCIQSGIRTRAEARRLARWHNDHAEDEDPKKVDGHG